VAFNQEMSIKYLTDTLFWENGEPLTSAHIDMEGLDVEVLKGGYQKQRNFTFARIPNIRKKCELIHELGYDPLWTSHVCGLHWITGILQAPGATIGLQLEYADGFNLALVTEAIFRMNGTIIFNKVYPCSIRVVTIRPSRK
jgi:hypothetical protein